MNQEWILIANATSGRIFWRGTSPRTLIPIADFEDSGAPDVGGTVRFSRFAQRIVRRLDEGLAAGQFDALSLVAPEPLLGMLKGALSAAVASTIMLALDEDLSHVGIAEMGRRLAMAEAGLRRCPADTAHSPGS